MIFVVKVIGNDPYCSTLQSKITMLSPHNLNIRLRRFKNMIKTSDPDEYHVAIEAIEKTCKDDYDMTYFSPENVMFIINKLEFAILCLFLDIPDSALEVMSEIRSQVLDKIFIRNLLFVNRFFKHEYDEHYENWDIGTLNVLPDLIKYEIHKIIYTSI